MVYMAVCVWRTGHKTMQATKCDKLKKRRKDIGGKEAFPYILSYRKDLPKKAINVGGLFFGSVALSGTLHLD